MKVVKRALYSVLGCGLCLLTAGTAKANSVCPTVGFSVGCAVVINVTSQSGGVASAFSVTATGQPAYDGVEDTLVGLTNNSGATITSMILNSTNGAFGFDNDGICTFSFTGDGYCSTSQQNGTDPQDYEGPNMTFTLSNGGNTLTIDFTGGVANGASTFFSLEGAPSDVVGGGIGGGGQTPEPASIVLLGTGVLGLFLLRRAAA